MFTRRTHCVFGLLAGSLIFCAAVLSYTTNPAAWMESYTLPVRDGPHKAGMVHEASNTIEVNPHPMYEGLYNFTVPTRAMLYPMSQDPQLDEKVDTLKLPPIPFLPNYKNPCWFEPLKKTRIYDNMKNHTYGALMEKYYSLHIGSMVGLYNRRLASGATWRLRCLPYYYVPGISKCGSTDLYAAIRKHPDVTKTPMKEPLFWNRIRMETPQVDIGWLAWAYKKAVHITTPKPVVHYIDLYDKAAEQIRTSVRRKVSDGNVMKEYHHMITGDGTPSYFYDFDGWTKLPINKGRTEPLFTIADIIAELTPNAKILIIVRNPIDRLFSDYKFFSAGGNKSPEDFHEKAEIAIGKMNDCLAKRTTRSCIYDRILTSHSMPLRLRVGMYEPFLQDWLKVFPRRNFFITRLEDYSEDREKVLADMFKFLELEPILADQNQMKVKNKSKTYRGLENGMLNATRALIASFYKVWNHKMADLVHDDKFLYDL